MSSFKYLVDDFFHDSPYSLLLSRESAETLCATRRSAGLPFMVQAFTVTEPKLNNQTALKSIFRDLLPMALSPEGIELIFLLMVCNLHMIRLFIISMLLKSLDFVKIHLNLPTVERFLVGVRAYSESQKVHALNVLRALYKTSSLGDAVQPFVSDGLKAAISGYKSKVIDRL